MKLATTTSDFGSFCANDCERIGEIRAAGFRYVVLSQYSIKTNADLLLADDWRDTVARMKETADRLGVTFVQSHSPGGNALDPDPAKVDELVAVTNRSIAVCAALGIPNTVVHAGFAKGIGKDEFFEKNADFYRRLFPAMEEYGVNVLVENSTRANMGSRYYLYTGADMKEFIDYVDHPLFHACWDTGHANIEGGQAEQIRALGSDLYALHINDNRGERDEHLIPYLGTVNMDDVMTALTEIGFEGPFTFEASSVLRPSRYWLGNRREFAEVSPRLAEPTIAMQRDLERLMFHVGEHILCAYGLLED